MIAARTPTKTAAMTSPVTAAMTATAAKPATTTTAAAVPDTAGITSAYAAAAPQRAVVNTEVFHSLFSDPGRSTPVAAVVSQLWGVSGASPSAMSDLFKDDGSSG